MDSPDDLVKMVLEETQLLTDYLKELPPEAWSHPTACERWEVADVVSHLMDGAVSYTDAISRGLQGDSLPPEGEADEGLINSVTGSDAIARSAIVHRKRLGDKLLSTFAYESSRLNHIIETLSPEDWDKPCYDSLRPISVRTFVNLRVFELALHRWDISPRTESSDGLSTNGQVCFLEMIQEYSGWFFNPGPRLGEPVRLRFPLAGAVSSGIDILTDGDEVSIEPSTNDEASTTFSCTSEIFAFLMSGRVSVEPALSSGRLKVEGDKSLVDQFGQWFPGA